ncbi:hypothetical protein [Pseudomarimonas arenosa]|uniref:ATP-binding protein n=1 Tax=Pseudomarimonas arenosa TaxID=2774145 RepID=A0AAW3ZQD2_9GAMM|nr:hypothetical protein [Pseudomarimonas arenosa]MBD8527352.1 hypothetical protein [Pseudomarimonas arenosa]
MSLRKRLAEFGFESNDDYDYSLRCLFEASLDRLRVMHVDGRGGRRKTAFANALAHALEFDHVLYHDFSRPEPAEPMAAVPSEDGQPSEPPLPAFERVLIEACAYSEAARTILILDQLQAAAFADHARLVRFVDSGEWSAGSASVSAHARNFLLALISEEPLYHSLARQCFRIWTDAERGPMDFRPEDFGLPEHARPLLDALAQLFQACGAAPTLGEVSKLLADLLQRAGSEEHLRQSMYGWIEVIDRPRLQAATTLPYLRAVLDAMEAFIGADHVELQAPD